MSEALRIGLVVEGPTDRIVIGAVLQSILGGRPFVLTQLQPEDSLAFGPLGSGWAGVYRWCKKATARGNGRLASDALLFLSLDLLILHLDADVAGKRYEDENSIRPDPGDGHLPCEQPCPPASASTDRLRQVLLSWCGETVTPPKTVICMPSKSTEAWVVAALYPADIAMKREIECLPDPESRLSQQPRRTRIHKTQKDYSNRSSAIAKAWPRLASPESLGEALRFQRETLAAIQ